MKLFLTSSFLLKHQILRYRKNKLETVPQQKWFKMFHVKHLHNCFRFPFLMSRRRALGWRKSVLGNSPYKHTKHNSNCFT